MLSAFSDQLRQLAGAAPTPAPARPELRNRGVQTPGPPAFPRVRKFTPKERSAASEAQSRAAKEANRSKQWLESRFCAAREEFAEVRGLKFGMTAGPSERLAEGARAHVALSACLNGEAVRHNAGHCYAPFIVDDMGEFLSFESVCPEVEGLGLGTPRETIRLVNTSGDLEDWGNTMLFGTKSGNNYTAMMAAYTASRLSQLDRAGINGYILKSQSPSCGVRGIPVYPKIGTQGRGSGKAQAGMFAKALMELWPELPIEDEGRLADVTLRNSFFTRAEAHRRWRRALQRRAAARAEGLPYAPLLDFHAAHVLLADSHSASAVPELEAIAAEAARRAAASAAVAAANSCAAGSADAQSASDSTDVDASSTADDPSSGGDSQARSSASSSGASSDSGCDAAVGEAGEEGASTPMQRAGEDELYHRYYHTFFMALKRCAGRAANARCLRHCLSVLRGTDHVREAPAAHEGETAAEAEERKEREEGDAPMLGLMLADEEEEDEEGEAEGGKAEAQGPSARGDAGAFGQHDACALPAPGTFAQRACVVDTHDADEIAESIEDYVQGSVPFSMPLNLIGRQVKRLARAGAKHDATAKQIGCDMGEHPGAHALRLLQDQAFLQPHRCKRVLNTIRQNKFGQVFDATHVAMCF